MTTPPASDTYRKIHADQVDLAQRIVDLGRWPRAGEQPPQPPAPPTKEKTP